MKASDGVDIKLFESSSVNEFTIIASIAVHLHTKKLGIENESSSFRKIVTSYISEVMQTECYLNTPLQQAMCNSCFAPPEGIINIEVPADASLS